MDEALVITGRPPNARYWSIHSLTIWQESPDYLNHPILFTGANTQLEPDGSFRIVVSHTNPGVANWLDTAGLVNLGLVFRAICCDDPELIVDWERVPLSSVS